MPLSGTAKYTLTLAAYTGVEATAVVAFARATDLSTTARAGPPPSRAPRAPGWCRTGPTSRHDDGVDAAGSVTTRRAACGADGGRICSALADSAAALPAGNYGNIEATTNAASDMATMWSFVLRPVDRRSAGNQPPTADFTVAARCSTATFDSSESRRHRRHDHVVRVGLRRRRDLDRGQHPPTPSRPQEPTTSADRHRRRRRLRQRDARRRGGGARREPDRLRRLGCRAGNSATPRVMVPASAAVGDRLVLALSLNNTTRTFRLRAASPAGPSWTTSSPTTCAPSSGRRSCRPAIRARR